MSEYSALIGPDRWALVTSGNMVGQVGKVVEWDHGFEKWVINVGGNEIFKETYELDPVFTMNQIVDVKLQESAQGSDLADKVKDFGMSSDDLADFVQTFIADCALRINGVGKQQYEQDGYQKFEVMDLDALFEYIEEEIRDIPNYCAMLFIRLRRLRNALTAIDIIEEKHEVIE